jgi:uncharacterized protein YndB with AHSA1/START domain
MAAIHVERLIDAPAEQVWATLRDVGALHTRVAPGFVVDTRLEGDARKAVMEGRPAPLAPAPAAV